jgi:hypothetical protein
MNDVYATDGTFADKHSLAQDLANAVMRWEQVPDLALFRDNTPAFIHDLPAEAISNAAPLVLLEPIAAEGIDPRSAAKPSA